VIACDGMLCALAAHAHLHIALDLSKLTLSTQGSGTVNLLKLL
jgi:hypothetical protein